MSGGEGDGEDVTSDCASDYTPGPAPKRHPTGVVGSSSGGTGGGATGGIGLHLSGGSNKRLGSLGHQVEKSQKLEDLREVVGEVPGTGGTDGPEEPALPSLEGVSEKQYTIYIAPGGGAFTTWNGSLTLELVNEKFWKVSRPLELCYTHTKDPK